MTTQSLALIIFLLTYIGIIFTRLPRMNIDRPSAAFFGAIAMIIAGVVPFEEAVKAVDYNTIALLLGMMIIISTLELDGFFSWIATQTMSVAKTPFKLLVVITFVTGVSSAFLVNDAVVLLFTPVIIVICRKASLKPIPFLIAEIFAANIGSAMTITGNPQNMLIGMNSGIPYGQFLLRLLPVSLAGMVISIFIVYWFFKKDMKGAAKLDFDNRSAVGEIPESNQGFTTEYNYKSMRTSVPIFIGVVILFFFSHLIHLSIPVIALLGAALILIFGNVKPSQIIRQVDWVLLVFFASLFIVVHGIETQGLLNRITQSVSLKADLPGLAGIHLLSLVLSQVVSNVPFTVIMLPFMKPAGSEMLWLALASASTLAGNATIIGAMANLIVIESAERRGIKIRFIDFLTIGIIVTLLTLLLSFGVLYMQTL